MTLRMRTLMFEVCCQMRAVQNFYVYVPHLHCTLGPGAVLDYQHLQQLHCILGASAVQHKLCYHFSQHLPLHVHRLQFT